MESFTSVETVRGETTLATILATLRREFLAG